MKIRKATAPGFPHTLNVTKRSTDLQTRHYLRSFCLVLPIMLLLTGNSQAQESDIVATVNGAPIHQSTIDAISQQFRGQQEQIGEDAIVDELINLTLVSQLAVDEGLHEREDIRSIIELQRIQLLANAYMQKMSESIEIPEDALQAEYDRQIAGVAQPEFLLSQILLETEADALEVLKSLAEGKDFAELASNLSVDPSGRSGGDLGWVVAASLPQALAAELNAMTAPAISDKPLQSEFGWHILQVREERGTPVPTLESVQPEVRHALVSRLLQERLEKIRNEAEITRN